MKKKCVPYLFLPPFSLPPPFFSRVATSFNACSEPTLGHCRSYQ